MILNNIQLIVVLSIKKYFDVESFINYFLLELKFFYQYFYKFFLIHY